MSYTSLSDTRPNRLFAVILLLVVFAACNNQSQAPKTDIPSSQESAEVDPVIRGISQLIEKSNTSHELYFKRSELLYQRERYAEAEKDISQAIELKDDFAPYYHLLADSQLDGAKSKEAIKTMQKVIELFPNRIPSYLKLSEFYFILKQYDSSLSTINEIIKLDPQNADAYFMLGMNFREMGDADKALNSLQRAVEIDADMVDAWILLGDIHEQKGQKIAAEYYQNAVASNPQNIEALHTLAYYYQNHENISEALKIYRDILDIDPKYTDAHLNSGILNLSIDSLNIALAHFNLLINMHPRASKAYYYRGLTREMLGETDKAINDYESSINLNEVENPAKEALEELLQTTK